MTLEELQAWEAKERKKDAAAAAEVAERRCAFRNWRLFDEMLPYGGIEVLDEPEIKEISEVLKGSGITLTERGSSLLLAIAEAAKAGVRLPQVCHELSDANAEVERVNARVSEFQKRWESLCNVVESKNSEIKRLKALCGEQDNEPAFSQFPPCTQEQHKRQKDELFKELKESDRRLSKILGHEFKRGTQK